MIMHIDLDTFFASAERTQDINLIGKALVVGGRGDPHIFDIKPSPYKQLHTLNRGAFVPSLFASNNNRESIFYEGQKLRGIVTTASYEARENGIKTAMTLRQAVDINPNILILPPNGLLYHQLSEKMHKLLLQEAPVVEQYSIDEFFCDISGWISLHELEAYAKHIQTRIAKELYLPTSIGIAEAKWIAKLATSLSKPYGITILRTQQEVNSTIDHLPIEDFPGVGRAFKSKMKAYAIHTIGEAKAAKSLINSWGRHGSDLYKKLTGTDAESITASRSRKSIGISRSMNRPILNRNEFRRRITVLVRHLSHAIMKLKVNPSTFYFAIGYEMHLHTKTQVTHYRIFNEKFFTELALKTFNDIDDYKNQHIVYIAITGSKFFHINPKPLNLLYYNDDTKMHNLTNQLTKIREKYGLDSIRLGSELGINM